MACPPPTSSATPGASADAPSVATSDPAFGPGSPFCICATQSSSGAATLVSRFCTASAQTRPSPIGSATPRSSTPSNPPNAAHIMAISQPAPMPTPRSAGPGQCIGCDSAAAMRALAAAPSAKVPSSTPSVVTASAPSFPPNTASRDGPCTSTVFQVPQPYSAPITSTPMISMIAPMNTGRPPIELPTSFSGSMSTSSRPLVGGPPVSPVSPVSPVYPRYGTR